MEADSMRIRAAEMIGKAVALLIALMLVIGAVTAAVSAAGCVSGRVFGDRLGSRSSIVGGGMLLGIAVKIMFFG